MMYETFMLTKYKVEQIEGELLDAILKPNPDFKGKKVDMPLENRMLDHKFEIVPVEEEYSTIPKFISNFPDTDVWFR